MPCSRSNPLTTSSASLPASRPRPPPIAMAISSSRTGVTFQNPLKLLLHHDIKMPVGTASFGKATDQGLPFTAAFPEVVEEGVLKARVDEAWQSVKYGLLTGRLDRIPPAAERHEAAQGWRLAFHGDRSLRTVARDGPGQRRGHDSHDQISRRASSRRVRRRRARHHSTCGRPRSTRAEKNT